MKLRIRSPVMGVFGTLCCETKNGAVAVTTNTHLFITLKKEGGNHG
jgi:hypothetical protein